MQKPTQLTIPCHWDLKVLDQIASLPAEKGIFVGEIYGSLAKGGPVGHGRSSGAVKDISREEAIEFRSRAKDLGINFTYLLNAPWKANQDVQVQKELDEYLNWILKEFKPDALTVSTTDLMAEIRKRDQDIAIHISTIAGVRTPEDLERFLPYKPNRIVPHHDLGKNLDQLRELTKVAGQNGMEVELLASESCLYNCPSREAHYRSLVPGNSDGVFHMVCNTKKLNNPAQFLMAGGMIRPEDFWMHEKEGVQYIKLSGRSKPSEWLPEVVEAYLNRSYDGNLIRLLGIDPSMKAEDWIFIDNKALDGFMEGFPYAKSDKEKLDYCQAWISELYKEGKFSLGDGSTYTQEGQSLCLSCTGERVASVINRERR